MKLVSTNKLNRLWNNGIKPFINTIEGKFDRSKMLNTLEEISANTSPEYGAGALAVKEINSNLIKTKTVSITTGSNGNVYLDMEGDKILFVISSTTDFYIGRVFCHGGGWYATLYRYPDGTIAASTKVTLDIGYMA